MGSVASEVMNDDSPKKNRPANVDEYLECVSSNEARTVLTKLREIIKSELPEAQEGISYGIPTYKQSGYVASFAAFKNHCSFFPGHTVGQFSEVLKDFKQSKGTVQFTPEKPIPEELVRAILRVRAAENNK